MINLYSKSRIYFSLLLVTVVTVDCPRRKTKMLVYLPIFCHCLHILLVGIIIVKLIFITFSSKAISPYIHLLLITNLFVIDSIIISYLALKTISFFFFQEVIVSSLSSKFSAVWKYQSEAKKGHC